jgi:hypothetical protein
VIKSIVADALGMHLDLFQRVVVDPASVTVIRYTSGRPFLAKLNDTGGGLGALVVTKKSKRRRAAATDSDAAVGGGAGAALTGIALPGSGSAPSHAAG